jgi:hypothetical protein
MMPPMTEITNVHQWVGWDRCANLRCQQQLGPDHVTMTTTTKMRRFCCVEHIADGQDAWTQAIYATTKGQTMEQALRDLYGPPRKDLPPEPTKLRPV